MRRTAITLVSLALTAAPLAATTPSVAAEAAAAAKPKVIAKNLVSPLSVAVRPNGTAWFSQNFAGQLVRARPGRKPRVVFQARRGVEVGAVSVKRGTVTFATTTGSTPARTFLKTRNSKGEVKNVANLFRYEKQNNPDEGVTYGFTDLDPSCEVPEDFAPYDGIVESHPYATLTHRGTTYVADAAANAILSVKDGVVDTVAVLPPQPLTVPAELAKGFGLPDCVVDHDYNFEPVPTDVEMGPDGMLYVTTLPGGPEDPSLGARAAVHRIDPATGDVETLVTGLMSATGLAVAPNGDMYVGELFRNRIAKIADGTTQAKRWRKAAFPGDVEFVNGRVWATRKSVTGLFPGAGKKFKGQVVRYPR